MMQLSHTDHECIGRFPSFSGFRPQKVISGEKLLETFFISFILAGWVVKVCDVCRIYGVSGTRRLKGCLTAWEDKSVVPR